MEIQQIKAKLWNYYLSIQDEPRGLKKELLVNFLLKYGLELGYTPEYDYPGPLVYWMKDKKMWFAFDVSTSLRDRAIRRLRGLPALTKLFFQYKGSDSRFYEVLDDKLRRI